MSVTESLLKEGKVYSFPNSAEALIQEENNRALKILFVSAIPGIIVATFAFVAMTKLTNTINPVLTVILSLMMGLIALMVSGITTASMLHRKTRFSKDKIGSLIQANWERFSNWLTWEFGIQAVNIIPEDWESQGSQFFGLLEGKGRQTFKDVNGETFSLHKLPDTENRYVVVHHAYAETEKSLTQNIDFSLDTVLTSGFKVPMIRTEPENVVCDFEDLLKVAETTVNNDFQTLLTEVKDLLVTLSACALTENDIAGTNRVHEELDDLSLITLQAIPAGIDSEFEEYLVTAITYLRDELITIKNDYLAGLKETVVNRLELFNVLFDSTETQATNN